MPPAPDRATPRSTPPVRGDRPTLAGVEVREDDVEPSKAIYVAGIVFRIAAVVILLLAAWQAWDWFRDPPPGGAGLSVIIGDSIRLVVVSVLLYGAADLADLFVKNFQENRAARILLARQTYLMKRMGIAAGELPTFETTEDRRGVAAEETVVRPTE